MYMEDDTEKCPACSTPLAEPYIQCAECGPPNLNLCLHCFSRGVEVEQHKNSHKYIVIVSTNFCLISIIFKFLIVG